MIFSPWCGVSLDYLQGTVSAVNDDMFQPESWSENALKTVSNCHRALQTIATIEMQEKRLDNSRCFPPKAGDLNGHPFPGKLDFLYLY
jgi:hypothetical protein